MDNPDRLIENGREIRDEVRQRIVLLGRSQHDEPSRRLTDFEAPANFKRGLRDEIGHVDSGFGSRGSRAGWTLKSVAEYSSTRPVTSNSMFGLEATSKERSLIRRLRIPICSGPRPRRYDSPICWIAAFACSTRICSAPSMLAASPASLANVIKSRSTPPDEPQMSWSTSFPSRSVPPRRLITDF